jgi:hypothetical protein
MSETTIPASPFGTKLSGRGAIAAYWLGEDTPPNRRRVSALMNEVREENRIPYGIDGDGVPFSYSGWIDQYALSRCRNRPRTAAEAVSADLPKPFPQRRAAAESASVNS